MKHLFVTGTDTGVGKTVVSALLAKCLQRKYWKPIQSGVSPFTDSEWVAQHLGEENVLPEMYRLSQPLSPHVSARLDQTEIRVENVLSYAEKTREPLVIEGAGGLLVPLNDQEFLIDLIAKLRTPCVLVALSSLGTINHTLLSLEALRSREIETIGVILVGTENEQNKKAITQYGAVEVIAEVPWLEPLDVGSFEALGRTISLEEIRSWISH